MIQIILIDNGISIGGTSFPNNTLSFRKVKRGNRDIVQILTLENKIIIEGEYSEFINSDNEPYGTVADVLTALELNNVSAGGGSEFTTLSLKGDATEGHGLLTLKSKTASVAFSGGVTETIVLGLPAGCLIIGGSLRNDTILVGAGATSYEAKYGAFGTPIGTGVSFAKNTKSNLLHIVEGNDDIILTPDAGQLDTGTVTAVVYYYELTPITDVE